MYMLAQDTFRLSNFSRISSVFRGCNDKFSSIALICKSVKYFIQFSICSMKELGITDKGKIATLFFVPVENIFTHNKYATVCNSV